MTRIWVYLITGALLPAGFPLLCAWVYTKTKGFPLQLHLLLGGGQLCFYGITLSLLNMSQVVAVRGRDAMKPWAVLVLGVVAALAGTVWFVGIAETLNPSSESDATKRRVTLYSAYVAAAAVVLGGMFRRLAGLL
jgi:hypothetical protein